MLYYDFSIEQLEALLSQEGKIVKSPFVGYAIDRRVAEGLLKEKRDYLKWKNQSS